ncbi:MAG: hypothetical protein R6X02_13545 [Enhygromyxa sp.]
MALIGSMTASVWLAPMIPKLPLPLAQRIDRLLQAKPGRETEAHALKLCEAIVAYAACVRVAVAVAVVPAARRSALSKAVDELRKVVERGEARIANFRDLLVAAANAIEALEPGHPLGRTELTRPRTAWVARTQLVEALGDSVAVDEATRSGALEGGIAGIVDLWVALVEARHEVEIEAQGDPWLPALGDVIVDMLGASALLGEASLTHPEPLDEGGVGELRRLHGLEAEPDDEPAPREAYEPGVVCWRFDDQVVSSCGLLGYWADEHDFDHVGVIARQRQTAASQASPPAPTVASLPSVHPCHPGDAEYLDYGSGSRSPATGAGQVAWDRLRVTAVEVEPERSASPVFVLVAAAIALLLVIAGVAWALWPVSDSGEPGQATGSSGQPIARTQQTKAQPEEPGPDPESEIVIETEPEPETSAHGLGGRSSGAEGEEPETAEAELPSASLWFESERNLGTCSVTYDGRTRNANLHLKTRAPEGKLEFSYRCGEHRGRGSIDVKRNRVNGVLFCKKNGAVKVKTVRSNEGRCDR